MPQAALLLRAKLSTNSLTNIVENSQHQKPPFPDYDIRFNASQVDITPLGNGALKKDAPEGIKSVPLKPRLTNCVNNPIKKQGVNHPDEGFESDVDSLSLTSSDDSFTSSVCLIDDHVLKKSESDSANCSSESESEHFVIGTQNRESFSLNSVLCYTDVNYPKLLVFVIVDDVLVFQFTSLDSLQQFYTSFNTLKAITNQRTYNTNSLKLGAAKFNLLQRTDSNGVTHIEISREATNNPPPTTKQDKGSNIISINTPEVTNNKNDDPKKPERKKKVKGRAPPPPSSSNPPSHPQQNDIMKGQFVRVSVDPKKNTIDKLLRNECNNNTFCTFSGNVRTFTPDWSTLQQQKPQKNPIILTTNSSEIPTMNNFKLFPTNSSGFGWRNTDGSSNTINTTSSRRSPSTNNSNNWTNSVPRLLLRSKQRSKSETRICTPMAYRYIDTTTTGSYHGNQLPPQNNVANNTISNRLFGLSQKLKEFGNNIVVNNNNNNNNCSSVSHTTNNNASRNFYERKNEARRNSIGELMMYNNNNNNNKDTNLKSVIKKQDIKKSSSGEKKVTFSAYATVQVV